jgi:hypothetical protein
MQLANTHTALISQKLNAVHVSQEAIHASSSYPFITSHPSTNQTLRNISINCPSRLHIYTIVSTLPLPPPILYITPLSHLNNTPLLSTQCTTPHHIPMHTSIQPYRKKEYDPSKLLIPARTSNLISSQPNKDAAIDVDINKP